MGEGPRRGGVSTGMRGRKRRYNGGGGQGREALTRSSNSLGLVHASSLELCAQLPVLLLKGALGQLAARAALLLQRANEEAVQLGIGCAVVEGSEDICAGREGAGREEGDKGGKRR